MGVVPAPSLTRLVGRLAVDGLVHGSGRWAGPPAVLVHLTRGGVALHRWLSECVERERHAGLVGAEPADAERLPGLLGGLVERLRGVH